jgi:hypothetical protein
MHSFRTARPRPRTFRPAHARLHFVTNLALGGGLMLTRGRDGVGRYAVGGGLFSGAKAKKRE